jgi:hypothetical protein
MAEVSEKELERRRNYYAKNKEKVMEYQRKKRANMTEEEKAKKKAYAREYYRKKKAKTESHWTQNKKTVTSNHKDIRINEYANGITLIEYVLWKKADGVHVQLEGYERNNFHLKRELERQLHKVDTNEKLVVIETNSVQIYLKAEESKKRMDQIISILEDFVKKNIKNSDPELGN